MVNIISDYIPPFASLPNIAPFTYKDGETYLSTLDNLRTYVNTTLVTFVNTNYQSLGDAFTLEINALITTVNATVTAMNGDVVSVQALHDQVAVLVVTANNAVTAAANSAIASNNSASASSASAAAALVDANNALVDVATIQSSLTGYVQKGKLVLNVKDEPYNAVGDGVADDTVAIQAALNAANGNIVFFPRGIYIISAPLVLIDYTVLQGQGSSGIYPNFTTDYQVVQPSWGFNVSTIQYITGTHGAIFSQGNHCTFENLIFRSSNARTTADVVFNNPISIVRFNNNVVQNMNVVLRNNSVAWGAWIINNNQFIACDNVFEGTFLDNRIYGNSFTSIVNNAISLTSGAGLNIITNNRFEFCEAESIKMLTGSRENIISNNIFDAHAGAAIGLYDLSDPNIFSNNLFWRSGRLMSNDFQDAHIYLKNTSKQQFNNNIFQFGGPDSGSAWIGPKNAISIESIINGKNSFRGNNFRNATKTSIIISDRYGTSLKCLDFDYIDIPIGALANTTTDDFANAINNISLVLINNVNCFVHEDRKINLFVNANKLKFIGVNGLRTLTNNSGNLTAITSLDNITYGTLTYNVYDNDLFANNIPDGYGENGNWPVTRKIYNTAPAASGFIGWVKITSGSPDVWKTFGPISA